MIFTFAGTIAQFINDNWQLVERLINFYHIQDKEHEGQWAAKAFVKSGAERGSADKISPEHVRLQTRCLHGAFTS